VNPGLGLRANPRNPANYRLVKGTPPPPYLWNQPVTAIPPASFSESMRCGYHSANQQVTAENLNSEQIRGFRLGNS
jgi:hypothetical protein